MQRVDLAHFQQEILMRGCPGFEGLGIINQFLDADRGAPRSVSMIEDDGQHRREPVRGLDQLLFQQ
ncbi:hypothetical protein OX89_12435, partial [Diaphorobacter sp. J5-51]